MSAARYDHDPILAPGSHRLDLEILKRRFVDPFPGSAYLARHSLYMRFEQLLQEVLSHKAPCVMYIDGSFLTRKPIPSDIDVIISIDEDVYENLPAKAISLFDQINDGDYIPGVDAFVFIQYPRHHPLFGSWSDPREICKDYGLENSAAWAKGYGIMRLFETDVGLRICH